MAIPIKNQEQINAMRVSAKIVAKAHEIVAKAIKPGVTTIELDNIVVDFFKSEGAIASFKGYHGFPNSICASINEEIIHGIPGLRKLKSGDIISIDIGAIFNGYHGDAARTHAVSEISSQAKQLIEVTEKSFFEGIKFAKEGNHLFEISAAIEDYCKGFGYSMVREFTGHGIGKEMHEEPQIPNFRQNRRGSKLTKGMVLAIEPMVNLGTHKIIVLSDGWTVITADKQISSHYENTIAITDGEPEILTLEG